MNPLITDYAISNFVVHYRTKYEVAPHAVNADLRSAPQHQIAHDSIITN